MIPRLESLLNFISIPLKREWRLRLLRYGSTALVLSLALPWYFVTFTESSAPIPGLGRIPGSQFHVVFGWNQGNLTLGPWLHITPDRELRDATTALKVLTALSLLAWLETSVDGRFGGRWDGRIATGIRLVARVVGRFFHTAVLVAFLVLVWQRTHLWEFATQYRVAAFEAYGKGVTGADIASRIYAIPFLGAPAAYLGGVASLIGIYSKDASPRVIDAAVATRRSAGRTERGSR